MKRLSMISAIVCMSFFMGNSNIVYAQNDQPATVNATTADDHDDDDDQGKWGLLGLLGLLGLMGLKRREATNHNRTTAGRP